MARTLLGNAHTRASPAALTGQPGCVSIPVVGAFIAEAVPNNSRDTNEPPPMASPAASKQYPNGAMCVFDHQPRSCLVVAPSADVQERRHAWATA